MSHLLQEIGDELLQETGDFILLDEVPRGFIIDGDSYSSTVLYADFSLTECANRGEIGMGGFDVFDSTSALDLPALKSAVYTEPAAVGNEQVFSGFIHDRAMGAMQDASLASRMHDVEVTDLNILASDYVLTDAESADRPAETDYVRMAWLMTSRLNSEGGVGVGVIPNTNTVDLEAVDYRGRKPADVAAECSEASGKLWFIYDYGAGPKMYYDLATGTSLPATLAIADDGTADGSTTFAPQSDVLVRKSPDRVYSTVHLTYNEGTVTVTDAAVEAAYRVREAAVLNTSITDSTVATDFANALLDASATELVEVEGLEIVVPAANVNDVRAGQYVTLTLSRQGISAADYRVIRRTVTPLATTHYLISLDLASDVLASANGSRGSDIIWPNKSNANDDGATVTIDRGGINVIDGAITVVNSGATVIIDGESDMFRIAASGTFDIVGPSTANNRNTDGESVATGLTGAPAFAAFVEQDDSSAWLLPFTNMVNGFGTPEKVIQIAVTDGGSGDTDITAWWWASSDLDHLTYTIRYYIYEQTAF